MEAKQIEDLTDNYKTRIRELKGQISDLRKSGKDPFIPAIRLRNLDSKIDWAIQNKEKEDFEKIEDVLEEVKNEILEEDKRPLVNIKAEVEALVKGEKKSESEKPEVKEEKSEEKKDEKEIRNDSSTESSKKAFEILEKDIKEEAEKEPEKKERSETILTQFSSFFHTRSGLHFKSISDLIVGLKTMPESDFTFHTRNEDNDFGLWIQHVFQQPELAQNIKGLNDRKKILEILEGWKRGE